MNHQNPPFGIEWTRIRRGEIRLPGYTWNVEAGCKHGCRWRMPSGKIAICYAESVAERVASAAYPNGFEHHYFHPDRLEEPLRLKTPAGIFLDSMSDLMGAWIPEDEIKQVLDVCARAHWHTFQLLTKNAPRLLNFQFPDNVWVGASSPPDFMFGKELSRKQQTAMLVRTLTILSLVKVPVRWVSFEPLSYDVSETVKQFPGAIQWSVIGAASDGRLLYPPAELDLLHLLDVLDAQNVRVFYKGNLRSLPLAAKHWREEFPT